MVTVLGKEQEESFYVVFHVTSKRVCCLPVDLTIRWREKRAVRGALEMD